MHKIFFVLLFCLAAIGAYAQNSSLKLTENSYLLEADEIYGVDNVSFTARGNVKIAFKNTQMFADTVIYYPQTRTVEAIGNVIIRDDIQEFRADRIVYHLENETGTIENATGILGGEYYVCADKIDRRGREYYMMEGVRVTTCSNPFPEWSFSFLRATAEIEGYLIGDHATANIKDFPYMYSPKLFYPLKFERQTGLLIPTVGYSTSLGSTWRQQFFWAIDLDKDMTFGVNAFSNRGFMGVSEFRYAISPESRLYFSGEAINDTETTADMDGRWRYTSKSIVTLPYHFELLIDADTVSDFMYMRDFSRFSIYDTNLRNRENVFGQQYQLTWYSDWSNISVQYRDEKKYKDAATGYNVNNVIQKPTFAAEQFNLDIGPLKMDYYISQDSVLNQDTKYTFNAGSTRVSQEYQRYMGIGSLYKTFPTPIMQLTPSATAYYTKWSDLDKEINQPNTNRVSSLTYLHRSGSGYERVIPEFSLRANINEIYKFYGTGKHGILNTIEYTFVEDLDQTGLPDHLPYDRIEKKNEISWTMRSYYTISRWNVDFRLKQRLSMDPSDNKPFRPLELQSKISKSKLFSNTLEMKIDYYGDNDSFGNKESVITFSDDLYIYLNQFYLMGSYAYNRDVANFNTTIKAGGGLTVGAFDFSTLIRWQGHNPFMTIHGVVPVENTISARWTSQCWSIGMYYQTEKYTNIRAAGGVLTREYIVGLNIGLRGLGESPVRIYSGSHSYD